MRVDMSMEFGPEDISFREVSSSEGALYIGVGTRRCVPIRDVSSFKSMYRC